MRRSVLYVVAVLVALVVVGAGVRLAVDRRTGPGTKAPPGPVPAPGQAFVTGAVDTLSAEGAQGPPLATPFTLTALVRGTGRATIANALVDGKRTSIVWPGGTPLPITGDGSIDLGGAQVDVDAGGATWRVDGAARPLKPGRYRAGAPVAVGGGNLAAAREAVDFTADAMTLVQSSGGVVVRVPPSRLELTGPGKVNASGRLQVRDAKSTAPAGTIRFGEGPYRITLVPAAGRLDLDAILQGPLTRS